MYKIDGQLAFIAHPRTGSRSTRDLLLEIGATQHAGHHFVDDAMIRNVLGKGGFGACTVRNMFDIMVSWYYNTQINNDRENPPTFDEYVWNTVEKPKHRWFLTDMYHYGLPFANLQIRYENLQEGVNEMLARMGKEPMQLPYVGLSEKRDRDYRPYYTDATRRAVEKRWYNDLHLTGYEF